MSLSKVLVASLLGGSLLLGTACGDDTTATDTISTTANPNIGEVTGAADTTLSITLTKRGCDPVTLTAPAGKIAFEVKNDTTVRNEFEILNDQPEILLEKFLPKGDSATFTAKLGAGTYKILCGPVAPTQGTLTITGAAAADTTPAKYDVAEMTTAIADYKTFVLAETEKLKSGTTSFTDAIRAGDVEKAKSLYSSVRVPWETIEPVAELFPESDALIDRRADDFDMKEADSKFTGFHRLEYGLWEKNSTDGLTPLADQLDSDIDALIGSVQALEIQPSVMVNGPGALIEETAQTKITGEEERYSHTDLVTFVANVDGSKQIVDLIKPMIEKEDPDLVKKIDASFSTIAGLVAPYQDGDTYQTYDKLTDKDRDRLKSELAQLAEELSSIGGTLGIEVNQ